MSKDKQPNPLDFLEEDLMDSDLERKAVPSGEFKLQLNRTEFNSDRPDKTGHLYRMLFFNIIGGDIPADMDPDLLKPVSYYLQIPIIEGESQDDTGAIKSNMLKIRRVIDALDHDPAVTQRQLIESNFEVFDYLAEAGAECWAVLSLSETPQYGSQNSIIRFK